MEFLPYISQSHDFRLLTIECTVRLPEEVEVNKVVCDRDSSFMNPNENISFSHSVKALRERDSNGSILHTFGIYDFDPDLYTAPICLAGYFKTFADYFGTKRLSQEMPLWNKMQVLEEKMLNRLKPENIIVCSGKIARELNESYGVEGTRLVPNASRLLTMDIDTSHRDGKSFTIGLIGNNLYAKGLVFAKKAMNRLARKLSLTCVVAGCDTSIANYLATGSQYALESVGKVNLRADFFRNLDCLLFPSIYEAHSLSILEAMSMAVPVVFSKSTGNYEDLCNMQDLILAVVEDPSDITVLAETTERLLTDESYRGKVVESGLRAAKFYSWEKTARQYLQVYRGMGTVS